MGKLIGGVTDALGLTDIKGTQQRGEQAAAAQRAAAQQAAQISAFRPVGMTSRFGSGAFDITDVGGAPRVTGASYTVSPELKAIQDQLMALTGGAVTTAEEAQMAAQPLGAAAQRLFGLGAGYLAETPEMARQRAFDMLQDVRRPEQMREEERLASSVFGRGRAGLNIGGAQPELATLAGARRMQELQLGAQAEQAAQQRQMFGSGLMSQGLGLFGQQYALPGQALAPLQSYLGTIGTIEEMGQQPLQLGLQIGGAAQQGASAAAGLLSQAAQTQYAGAKDAAAINAQLIAGIAQGAGSAFGGGMKR